MHFFQKSYRCGCIKTSDMNLDLPKHLRICVSSMILEHLEIPCRDARGSKSSPSGWTCRFIDNDCDFHAQYISEISVLSQLYDAYCTQGAVMAAIPIGRQFPQLLSQNNFNESLLMSCCNNTIFGVHAFHCPKVPFCMQAPRWLLNKQSLRTLALAGQSASDNGPLLDKASFCRERWLKRFTCVREYRTSEIVFFVMPQQRNYVYYQSSNKTSTWVLQLILSNNC
jgi:hypothetical protein